MKPGVIVGGFLLFTLGCTNTVLLQSGKPVPEGIKSPVDVIPTRDKSVQADPARGPRGYSIAGSRHNKGGASPGLGSGTNSSGAGGTVRKE